MRIRWIALAAVVALGLFAPAASAGQDESIKTKRGQVQFLNYYDVLVAADTKKDGYGIVAYLEWQGDSYETAATVTDDDGANNGSASSVLRLRERTPVWLMMCYVNKAGDWVQCSDWQRAKA